MKKTITLTMIALSAILFSCESNTYEEIEQAPSATTTDTNTGTTTDTETTTDTNTTKNATYTTDIKPIITTNCTECHYSGGQSPTLTTYTQVKNAASASKLLCCIQAQGCITMPPSGKMSQTKIDLILLWKTQGYTE
jgi:hypothetical protein